MSGKHYNRSVRSHKVVYEALVRLLFQRYLESLSADKKDETITMIGKFTQLLFFLNYTWSSN